MFNSLQNNFSCLNAAISKEEHDIFICEEMLQNMSISYNKILSSEDRYSFIVNFKAGLIYFIFDKVRFIHKSLLIIEYRNKKFIQFRPNLENLEQLLDQIPLPLLHLL